MLDSLHIQNYRLFKDFKIDKLGQVNLIAGKNNTGKTALLEAVRILISKGDNSVLSNILFYRDNFEKNRDLDNYKTLFNNENKEIKINNISIELNTSSRKFEYVSKDYFKNGKIKNETTWVGGIDRENNPYEELFYISFKGDFKYQGWENFTIDDEDSIIEILKVVEKNVIDFRIIDSNKPVLRIEGSKNRHPIKYLGDGVGRVFTIAYALVKAKKSILLIDEFEVGLHHSIQKQLWDIIFEYAKEWNIQVFATTHSQDTIENFYYVANKYGDMGKYFVLSKVDDNIEAINYDLKEMKLALETNLELR